MYKKKIHPKFFFNLEVWIPHSTLEVKLVGQSHVQKNSASKELVWYRL